MELSGNLDQKNCNFHGIDSFHLIDINFRKVYTGCFTGDALLDYTWAVIFANFVSMQDDWRPLELRSEIFFQMYRESQKSVRYQT